ncbi:MAG: M1 family metallopeptidase, partial [bacterium]|nr:M1 family metallopeptidase [bacterium]
MPRRNIALLISLLALACFPSAVLPDEVDVYSRPLQDERSSDYDVLHYRIKLKFDDPARSFFGETTITLRPLRDQFDVCTLDAETFQVTRVQAS